MLTASSFDTMYLQVGSSATLGQPSAPDVPRPRREPLDAAVSDDVRRLEHDIAQVNYALAHRKQRVEETADAGEVEINYSYMDAALAAAASAPHIVLSEQEVQALAAIDTKFIYSVDADLEV